ncbi:MAG TPA: zf-HC2 domain-containing protein, partial [Marmoricola sp.]|nr:zf-HC2 domain-containing protein [Marmoricola sp.]
MPLTDHRQYSDWDAAYVLGSLSREERLEFEHHLEGCELCQMAIRR